MKIRFESTFLKYTNLEFSLTFNQDNNNFQLIAIRPGYDGQKDDVYELLGVELTDKDFIHHQGPYKLDIHDNQFVLIYDETKQFHLGQGVIRALTYMKKAKYDELMSKIDESDINFSKTEKTYIYLNR